MTTTSAEYTAIAESIQEALTKHGSVLSSEDYAVLEHTRDLFLNRAEKAIMPGTAN